MTKQEMREEMRDAMGNPQIKARVRQIQRAMRRRRVKADMSRASVVITNPTHYAVALEFSFETMQAPTVLAKGRDLQAAEIQAKRRDGHGDARSSKTLRWREVCTSRLSRGSRFRSSCMQAVAGHPGVPLSAEGRGEDARGAGGAKRAGIGRPPRGCRW